MGDIISEYQKWKEQGQELRIKARQAMESRYRDLLAEAVRIAGEYRADFGSPLKPPPFVTAFRYRSSARAKTRPAGKPKPAAKTERAEPVAAPPKVDRRIVGLKRQLAGAQARLEAARAAGKATRPFEDKIYEIEDALRLSGHSSQGGS